MSIHALAKKYQEYAVGIRREFHKNPEVGMKEFRTQKRVFEELDIKGFTNDLATLYHITHRVYEKTYHWGLN